MGDTIDNGGLCRSAAGVRLSMVFLDGTNMRAHQKAAGAPKRGDLRPSETIVKRLAAHVVAKAPAGGMNRRQMVDARGRRPNLSP